MKLRRFLWSVLNLLLGARLALRNELPGELARYAKQRKASGAMPK